MLKYLMFQHFQINQERYKRGGRGARSGFVRQSYERFPYSVRMGAGDSTQKKQVSETISRFMKNAKIGDVYEAGNGFGSSGGARFQVVQKGASGMGLKWINSNRPALKFDRKNVRDFIANGAMLISRK